MILRTRFTSPRALGETRFRGLQAALPAAFVHCFSCVPYAASGRFRTRRGVRPLSCPRGAGEERFRDAVRLRRADVEKRPAAAKSVLAAVIPRIPIVADWPEHRALDAAIVTDRALWPEETVRRLGPILQRFAAG